MTCEICGFKILLGNNGYFCYFCGAWCKKNTTTWVLTRGSSDRSYKVVMDISDGAMYKLKNDIIRVGLGTSSALKIVRGLVSRSYVKELIRIADL